MKKILNRIGSTLKKPVILVLSILLVAVGLFLGMYAFVQDSFFKITTEHEMDLMHVVERLGSKVVDVRLAELKSYCIDMLSPTEIGLIPEDDAEIQTLLQQIALPDRAINVAYQYGGQLICRDDSFRKGLEKLDLASVAERKEAVIFDPYFDEDGTYILAVAAATQESPGVFIVQYDGFCLSDWLGATASMMDIGTIYLVDSKGYNIAAAREEEREWVTGRYNAQLLAQQDPTSQNVSVAQLEKRALDGETGIGTYEWEGGVSYVAYGPLTEVPWGYYAGYYGWEFTEYSRNVAAISSQSGILLLLIFGAFMGCILALVFRSLAMERKYNQVILQQKREAEERSLLDSLTGAKNKRAWQEACEKLDQEIRTGAGAFAIVVCDVNFLKRVNDTLGHEAGDKLILQACRYICRVFSHSPVYRIGGDEFTVILRGEDLEDWERLMAEFDQGMTDTSIAVGISHYQPGDKGASEVFHRADQAMYRKKTEMKSRISPSCTT